MKKISYPIFFMLCIIFYACKKEKTSDNVKILRTTISLNTDSTYIDTIGFFGDEEGAGIITPPHHAALSNLQRTTDVAIYFYKPMTAYIGKDSVEIGEYRGSDGATPSKLTVKHQLIFTITN